MLPLKSMKLQLVRDPDTRKIDWMEPSAAKEITSFDQWLKAHIVYMAMYIDAHPEQALEMVKYESVIHDCSLRYEWDAVLMYDFHFRHGIAEDPSRSWAKTDTELYAQCFTNCGLAKKSP